MRKIAIISTIGLIVLTVIALNAITRTRYCGHEESLWERVSLEQATHCCRSGSRLSDLRQLHLGLEMYRMDNDDLPPDAIAQLKWYVSDYLLDLDDIEYRRAGSGYTLLSPASTEHDVSYLMRADGAFHYSNDGDATFESPVRPR